MCSVGTRRSLLRRMLAAVRCDRRTIISAPIPCRAAAQPATEFLFVAAEDASPEDQAAATFICDGSDDAAVVMDAITALPPEGGTVRLSAGHFDFGESGLTIHDRPGIVIEGAGWDVTFVRNRSSVDEDREVFDFTNCDRAAVRDIAVTAAGPPRLTSDAFDFDNCSGCILERVRITASRGRGIIFDGKASDGRAIGNIVRGCEISGCAGSGIELLCTGFCDIIDCSSQGNGDAGLKINRNLRSAQNSSHNIVLGGEFAGNVRDGISIYESDANAIVGARCVNNRRDGIRVEAFPTSQMTAEENRVLGSICDDDQVYATQKYGIDLIADPAGTVANTQLWDNKLTGNVVGDLVDGGSETQTVDRDPDKILLTGRWRCAVVAAARGEAASEFGLVPQDRQEWLVIVADITNWSTTNALLGPRALRARPDEDAPSRRARVPESALVAQRIGLTAGATDVSLRFGLGATLRVVLVYLLPEGAQDPRLVRGRAELSLASMLESEVNLRDLPPVSAPPVPVAPPPPLGPGVGARIMRDDETLRASPGHDGESEARLEAGTVVVITGPQEPVGDAVWWPVEAVVTGDAGYIDEAHLFPADS